MLRLETGDTISVLSADVSEKLDYTYNGEPTNLDVSFNGDSFSVSAKVGKKPLTLPKCCVCKWLIKDAVFEGITFVQHVSCGAQAFIQACEVFNNEYCQKVYEEKKETINEN